MNRKRVILVIIIVAILGAILFAEWKERSKLNVMGNIIDSIPLIDTIILKDGKTKEEILTLTESDPSFTAMANIYARSYYDIKWFDRKLLNGEPFVEVEYLIDNEIRYTLSIFEIPDHYIDLLPSDVTTEVRSYSYSYSPEGSHARYIFAIEEIHQLVGVSDGLKELVNIWFIPKTLNH